MKKIVLSLAGVLAATAFAPEAAAVPSFARQVGMACSACHFQSFPALTAFGRSFKTAGFTMMGAQGKVEGDHGLSIPDTLNMSLYLVARYKKTGGTDTTVAGNNNLSTNSGRIDVPDEFVMFAGGRVAENIGAYTEINLNGAGANMAHLKLPIMFDVGSVKLGVIPFTSSDGGPQYAYDLFATGSTPMGRVIENGLGYSAAMYILGRPAASGAAVVVANETFHVSYTPWVQGFAATNNGVTATKLGGNYIRAAWTPNYANWDLGVGVMHFSGNSLKGIDTTTLIALGIPVDAAGNATTRDSATVIDFQGQGEVAAMPLGIYGSWGWADGQTVGAVNTLNMSPERKSAFGLLADLGVIPQTLNLQLGLMRAKTGANVGAVAGTNESDNSYTLGARYKLAQNVKLTVAYTKSSGSAYNLG
ncbi:MAG: hypothetical protein A3K04_09190, partial [Gallionellales bacterium RBG_16_56_9]